VCFFLCYVLADLIDQVKMQLKEELQRGDPTDAAPPCVPKEVFNQSENQVKIQLLSRFAVKETWGAARDKELTLAQQCTKAVNDALDAVPPDQHSFATVLKQLRTPDFITREINSLKDHRLNESVRKRQQAEKEQAAAKEEQRRQEAEQRQKEQEQKAAEEEQRRNNAEIAMEIEEEQVDAAKLNQHEGDAGDAEPAVNPPSKEQHPDAAPTPADDRKQEPAAAASGNEEEAAEEAADNLEARVAESVEAALLTSRFICADAKDPSVSGEGGMLALALKELADTLEGRDSTLGADYLWLDAPKQSLNYADHFERRFDAGDLQTLVSNLVTLLRPGGILAVLCDTDQCARLWSYAHDMLPLDVWVVAVLTIVCNPDALPKGNQHVQGPLDIKSVFSQQRAT